MAVWEWGEGEMYCKDTKKTCGIDGNVPYLAYGDGLIWYTYVKT